MVAYLGCAMMVLLSVPSHGANLESDAWAAYEAGHYATAYPLFLQLFRDHPQDEQINFALGIAALKTGELSHARFAFERVLAMRPDNQRARLELGRTLTAMGLFELAREEFEKVLLYRPPERVRTNIEDFLTLIKRNSRLWTAEARISLGGFYDDNINIGPSRSLVDTEAGRLEVDRLSRPQSAGGFLASGSAAGTYDLGDREDWLLTGGLEGSQTWLPESQDHELRYLNAQAGLRHAAPSTILDLPLKVSDLDYGHDRLVSLFGTDPMFLFAASREWHHITQAGMEYRDYHEGEARDGMTFRFSQTLKRYIGHARHSLALTLGGFHEAAELGGYANQGPEASLTGEFRPRSATTLYALASYRGATYRDKLLPGLQSEPRQDHELQYVVGLRQTLIKQWGLDLNCRHVDNRSNFDLYRYDRNIVSASTFLCF